MIKPKNGWDVLLENEFSLPYYKQLENAVDNEYKCFAVFPPQHLLFAALDSLSLQDVRVVILGQDPYFIKGYANGMAFAVNKGIGLPRSLKNIYKEIQNEFGVAMPQNGTLLGWARQGVLLLNSCLSVREGVANSHKNFGWQRLSDAIISICSNRIEPMVFLLWGEYAQKKAPLIAKHHLVLTSAHPSPQSAYKGFFGCNHFLSANEFLKNNGYSEIDFTIVD